MWLIPQMLNDDTLRSRYAADMQKLARGDATADLKEEVSALEQEHRRRGLALPVNRKPATVEAMPPVSGCQLYEQLEEANRKLCAISVRSKAGKQLKRDITAIEQELRRRGLPLPIDAEVARMRRRLGPAAPGCWPPSRPR